MITVEEIKKIKKILESMQVDFRIIGGAAYALHTDNTAKDIDILLLDEGNLNNFKNIQKVDYPITEKPEPQFRGLIINNIPVQCIRLGDFEMEIEEKLLIANYKNNVMSLNSTLVTSKDKPTCLKRMKEIIEKFNLNEDWCFDNLPEKGLGLSLWNTYATAYDSVNNINPKEIVRWGSKIAKNRTKKSSY